jgi:hypothetical protein
MQVSNHNHHPHTFCIKIHFRIAKRHICLLNWLLHEMSSHAFIPDHLARRLSDFPLHSLQCKTFWQRIHHTQMHNCTNIWLCDSTVPVDVGLCSVRHILPVLWRGQGKHILLSTQTHSTNNTRIRNGKHPSELDATSLHQSWVKPWCAANMGSFLQLDLLIRVRSKHGRKEKCIQCMCRKTQRKDTAMKT